MWCILDARLATCVHKFLGAAESQRLLSARSTQRHRQSYLEEHLAKDSIRFLLEDRRENDSDAIRRSLHVYSLFIAVVNLHQFALPSARFQRLLRLERALERRSKRMTLEQCDRQYKRLSCLCITNDISTNPRRADDRWASRCAPASVGACSRSMSMLTLKSASACGKSMAPYSLPRISKAPYCTSSSQHRMLMDRRSCVFFSGVDNRNRTPS